MRVLVVESDPHSADSAVAHLQEAGHEIVRCHEPGQAPFPCNALRAGAACPLDTGPGVDVVLDSRAHPYPRPTAFEDGVSCAVRRSTPLVIAGTDGLNPFDEWTTATADDESVVVACERAAAAPIKSLTEVARAKVQQLLSAQPELAASTDVFVTRAGGRLEAEVVVPADAEEVEASLAVGVAGAIRTRDRWTQQVDVCIRRVPVS